MSVVAFLQEQRPAQSRDVNHARMALAHRHRNRNRVRAGTADVVLGVLMVIILIVRPSGITRSREFSLPRRRRPVADLEKARVTT